MDKSSLAVGEEILGSWSVYLGDPSPNSTKITGKLHVTNQNIHFEAGLALAENAAAQIGRRIKAFEKSDKHIAIPFSEIGAAQVVKKSLFQKALSLKLKSGEEMEFQFGAASPQKALDAIVLKL
jgi:hypothetical protein